MGALACRVVVVCFSPREKCVSGWFFYRIILRSFRLERNNYYCGHNERRIPTTKLNWLLRVRGGGVNAKKKSYGAYAVGSLDIVE